MKRGLRPNKLAGGAIALVVALACLLAPGLSNLLHPPSHSMPTGIEYTDLGEPDFSGFEATSVSFEDYSELDRLGRCGVATACIGQDLMPTEKRKQITSIKPTGWHRVEYDFVDGGLLYNRCHLIAYSLAGEDLNDRNLITGTRQMNTAMIGFEDMVYDYVMEQGGHVLYRVTPVFEGDELVARGVQMEALSVEDGGKAVHYNVYIPNEQEGVIIDYATGRSQVIEQ